MSQKYTDPYSGKRKSLRHANQCAHKRRLRALMRATGNWYPAPVGWSNYECTTEHWQHPLAPAEGAWIVAPQVLQAVPHHVQPEAEKAPGSRLRQWRVVSKSN